MSLVSLVYISTATGVMTDDDLKDILAASRRNNPAAGITGMLLYRDGLFIQTLEGEEDAVEKLYRKISRDPRHTEIMRLYYHPAKERRFGDWSMGFNKLEADIDEAEMPGYTDFLESPVDNMDYLRDSPDRVLKLLQRFKERSFF